MAGSDFHEDYAQGEVKTSSDRSFGIVFAVVFALVALLPILHGGAFRAWAAIVAGAFLAVALVRPGLLAPLNRVWTAFGMLLHKVTNPIIMGLVFYGAVTPTALAMRAMGKDPLRLRIDRKAASYWIERDPPGPAADTMNQQF